MVAIVNMMEFKEGQQRLVRKKITVKAAFFKNTECISFFPEELIQ